MAMTRPSTSSASRRQELHALKIVADNTPDPYGQLAAKMESLQLRIPPQKMLPPELLVEIFKLCADFPNATALPPKPDDVLLVLTNVCSTWRSIVVSISELWSAVAVSLTQGSDIQVDNVAVRVGDWLARAMNTTLSLAIDCSRELAAVADVNPILTSSLSALIASIVLQNTSRIKFLRLVFPPSCLSALFDVPAGGFPELQSFEIGPHIFDSDLEFSEAPNWQWRRATPGFTSAERLSRAVFSPVWPTITNLPQVIDQIYNSDGNSESEFSVAYVAFHAAGVELPWRNLRSLEFVCTMCSTDVWLNIFPQCPLLEICHIGVRPGPEPPARATESLPVQIRLENLDYIYLVSAGSGGDTLLASLVAPNLQRCGLQGQISTRALFAFQTRSGFALRVLVTVLHIATLDVYPLLEYFPTLNSLGFCVAATEHFPPDIWARIARRELLPELLCLMLTPRVEQVAAVATAIEENWKRAVGAGTAYLGVKFVSVPPDDVPLLEEALAPLARYEAFGMQVEFC
ncbi:F-box domain-containing protein [Mycena indigotica]|uniref:F-box domain-containing protein n=1 Tax=Mycena indigotica TaxID=2126181 RepID=A0A8H6VYR2_9AGAR|nr:F-box domain-containing protein [Mycena indigotica]KAF7296746.1 F-box domain-containing protein [Mycena indigotica]